MTICENSPLASLFAPLVDTKLDVGIMDRSADVHEISLTLEFPALGLSGPGRKLSEDLVRFFLLSIRVPKKEKKERAMRNIHLVGDFV